MSKFILTRDCIQCRSHHIKLIRTFSCIKRIVRNLKKKIGATKYSEIQQLLTSNNKIFDKNIKEMKLETDPKSYSDSDNIQNPVIQTNAG